MRRKTYNPSDNSLHIALLIIRVSFGIFYIVHGWPKISGGTDAWAGLGGSMEILGISFAPVFWGFMAALAEFGGGILLIFGLFTRPVAALMFFTMVMATLVHVTQGDPINAIMNPLKGLVVFAALIISGAGRFSVDYNMAVKR
jgi:putative oxidoreductase